MSTITVTVWEQEGHEEFLVLQGAMAETAEEAKVYFDSAPIGHEEQWTQDHFDALKEFQS